MRIIREDEPSRLGSINTIYRGDIETIVAKALAKEKERRYQSAAELAADARRYLADEPITAPSRPDIISLMPVRIDEGKSYDFLLRRNRVELAGRRKPKRGSANWRSPSPACKSEIVSVGEIRFG